MRNSIIAGLIAGFFAGITATIIKISNLHGWFLITPYESIPFNMQMIAQVELLWYILWGIIFGVFYAFFYDYISGTGVKKGIIYGLIIWIIVNFRFAAINAVYGYYQWSIPDALSGFFAIGIVYGLTLGYLYKPTK